MRRLLSALAGRRMWRIPVVVWLALCVLLATGGGAYAYFSSSGTGTGHAAAGTTVTLTVVASTAAASLYPGKTGTLYFKVTNANPVAMKLVSVQLSVNPPHDPTSTTQSKCTGHTSIVATTLKSYPYPLSPVITVPAETHETQTFTITGVVKLKSTAATGCQGRSFTVHLILQAETT